MPRESAGVDGRLSTVGEGIDTPTRRHTSPPLRLVARIAAFQAVETGSKPVGVTIVKSVRSLNSITGGLT